MKFKHSVRIKQYTPALAWMLYQIEKCEHMHQSFPEIVITSINDSSHMEGSRHYTGEAVDIRTHNFPDMIAKNTFVNTLLYMLNNNFEASVRDRFSILHESVGTPNEHIHVQVKRGQKYP
jgi:CRISPR/Cas system CMR-associated protein Cmr5 small subunit